MAASAAARPLLRHDQRMSRSDGHGRRALIGRSSRNRCRSSASCRPSDSGLRLAVDRLVDDRLQVARNLRVDPLRSGRHPVGSAARVGSVRDEGRAEGQQLIERHAQPVDVAPRSDVPWNRSGAM